MIIYRARLISWNGSQLCDEELFTNREKNFAIQAAKEMSEDFSARCKGQNEPIVERLDLGEITPHKVIKMLQGSPYFLNRVVWRGKVANQRETVLKLGSGMRTIDLAEADKCEPSEDDWKEEPQCS